MPGVDAVNFGHSLCKFLVARAAARPTPVLLNYADTDAARDLFRNTADEARANDPYATLKFFGGPDRIKYPRPRFSAQLQAWGTGNDATQTLMAVLFDGFCDAIGRPLQMQTINGFRAADDAADGTYLLIAVEKIQPPGITGRDDRGRVQVTFNVDVSAERQ